MILEPVQEQSEVKGGGVERSEGHGLERVISAAADRAGRVVCVGMAFVSSRAVDGSADGTWCWDPGPWPSGETS